MCITIWSNQNTIGYKLILASNRDEFLHRPSAAATWHSFETINTKLTTSSSPTFNSNFIDDHLEKEILSGRDLVAGGTWLGISKNQAKFAFLTNIAEIQVNKNQENYLHSSSESSRGLIIKDSLKTNEPIENIINKLKSNDSIRNLRGFNFIIGQFAKTKDEHDKIMFFSNRDQNSNYSSISNNQHDKNSSSPSNLVYGISNGIAGHQSHTWPKVSLGINLMQNCLKSQVQQNLNNCEINQNQLEQDLFKLLSQTDHSTEHLPNNILIRPQHRIIPPNTQPSYQTWYGTRTQTIIIVSQTRVTFIERDAFQIKLEDQSEGDNLGNPIWLGDDQSKWRRFEFELSS